MYQVYFHDISLLIYVDMDNLLNDDMNYYRNNHNTHVDLDINPHYFEINYQDNYSDIFQTINKMKLMK